MTARTQASPPRDQVVTSVADRRSTILDVIRNARESIAVSLFRCNDAEVFAELARATARGVRVDAVITSRAKGGKADTTRLDRLLYPFGVTRTVAACIVPPMS